MVSFVGGMLSRRRLLVATLLVLHALAALAGLARAIVTAAADRAATAVVVLRMTFSFLVCGSGVHKTQLEPRRLQRLIRCASGRLAAARMGPCL